VLSNTFSTFTPKIVTGNVSLQWIPTALIEAQNRQIQTLHVVGWVLLASLLPLSWLLVVRQPSSKG
jgi:hypothetical protein